MSTITSLLQVRDRLRADDTPTPPSRNDTPTRDTEFERMEISNPTTPTRNSFAGIQGQLPLPDEPLDLNSSKVSIEGREDIQEQDLDDDIDMRSADVETVDDDASENESITSDSQRPSKKKKGQRFFCTEFPPCQLSFTRSEHLARHIRKHTGERPFQCHCSRRFSRLDNLRQHAQTVHVNEEIPGDSLAATSTRFQRQIRTDRVRSTTSRPRGSTMGGNQTPTHSRGHSRNLSTSSIGSVGSFTTSDEPRRRQPQLAIATEGLKRPLDTNEYASEQYYSPGVSTPTSQIFSSSLGSPGYQPTFTSPSSRSSYYGPPRHNRRLSVPTGPNPFTNAGYAPGFYTPISPQASIYSQNTSGYASPTSSIVSPSRRESESEIEYRRRTWHPSSQTNFAQRPATSGLSYHQTPDEPRPALSQQPAASQITRLPGIESFDHGPRAEQVESGRPTSSYDNGLQQGLTRLDITANQPEPWQTPLQHVMQPQHQHHISMPEVPITPRRNKRQAWYGGPVGPAAFLQPTSSHRPSPEDSGSSDGGVSTPQQPPGQDYIPVIANEAPQLAPREYHQQYAYVQDYQHKPTLPTRADSGFGPFSAAGSMTAMAQQSQTYQLQTGHDARFANGYMSARPERNNHDMGRLEALVAVATSENRAVEGQR